MLCYITVLEHCQKRQLIAILHEGNGIGFRGRTRRKGNVLMGKCQVDMPSICSGYARWAATARPQDTVEAYLVT